MAFVLLSTSMYTNKHNQSVPTDFDDSCLVI